MPLSVIKSTIGTRKPQVEQIQPQVQQNQPKSTGNKINLFDFSQQSTAQPNAMGFISSIGQSTLQQPKTIQVPTYKKIYFSDEKQIVDDMATKGYTEDIARKTIENRRKALLQDTKLKGPEAGMLTNMANAGLTTTQAVEGLKRLRSDDLKKQWEKMNMGQKIGKTFFDFVVGTLSGGVGEVGGITDFVTQGQSDIAKQGLQARDYIREVAPGTATSAGELLGAGAVDYTVGAGLGKVLGVGAKFNALSSTKQLIGGGALGGALTQIGEKGAETTMSDIVTGAGLGVVGGLSIGKVVIPAITKTVQKGIKYGTAGMKGGMTGLGKSISRDINNAFSGQKMAGVISTKANRFRAGINKNPTEEFTKKFGETPGEFAVNRGMTKTGDDAVIEATNLYKKSMNEADKAFESIQNKITSGINKKGDDVLAPILNDLDDRLTYVKSSDAGKIKGYINKLNSGEGLTMSEINDIKRVYAQNFKYTILDNVGKDALRSANLQNDLREWQFNKAKEFGLTNIREINKNTQAWRMFADELAKSQRRGAGNNALSLTDWIALSGGEPTNIALFLGKKAIQSKYLKEAGIKILSKKIKSPIVKASNLKSNGKTNVTNNSVPRNRSSSSTKGKIITNPNRLLPKGKKQPIVTPQTVEKGVIAESKKGLEKTKFGMNKNNPEAFNYKLSKQVISETDNIDDLKSLKKDIQDLGLVKQKELIEEIDSKIAGIEEINSGINNIGENFRQQYGDDLTDSFKKLHKWERSGVKTKVGDKYTKIEELAKTSKEAKIFYNEAKDFIENSSDPFRTVQEVYDEMKDGLINMNSLKDLGKTIKTPIRVPTGTVGKAPVEPKGETTPPKTGGKYGKGGFINPSAMKESIIGGNIDNIKTLPTNDFIGPEMNELSSELRTALNIKRAEGLFAKEGPYKGKTPAVEVVIGRDGAFMIQDGHHRVMSSYILNKEVPVKIIKSDFKGDLGKYIELQKAGYTKNRINYRMGLDGDFAENIEKAHKIVFGNTYKSGFINPGKIGQDIKKIGQGIKDWGNKTSYVPNKRANIVNPKSELINEAKKYKSADEFIKGLEEKGKIIYHGNNKLKDFTENRIKRGNAVYFSPDKGIANIFADEKVMSNGGNKTIAKVFIDKNAKIYNPNDLSLIKYINNIITKKKGYTDFLSNIKSKKELWGNNSSMQEKYIKEKEINKNINIAIKQMGFPENMNQWDIEEILNGNIKKIISDNWKYSLSSPELPKNKDILENLGFDGYIVKEGEGAIGNTRFTKAQGEINNLGIINLKVIKTESQLKQIYEQAHKPKAILPPKK